MDRLKELNPAAHYWAIFFMAVGLQFLITLEIGGNQIRVALADIILPVLALFLYVFSIKNASQREYVYQTPLRWFLFITVLMTIALLNGVVFTETIYLWAFVNKYLGWFFLCGFFWAGYQIGRLKNDKYWDIFCKSLMLLAVTLGLVDYWPFLQTLRGQLATDYFRMEAWIGNPNAFGLLMAVLACIYISQASFKSLFGKKLDQLFLAILLGLMVFSGSRSAWLGFGIGVISLFFVRALPIRLFVQSVAMAIAFVLITFNISLIERWITKNWAQVPQSMQSDVVNNEPIHVTPYVVEAYQRRTDAGINHRVAIMRTGLSMWELHPFFGIGLGSFLWSEKQKGNSAAIHMTAGWWLVEMGVIGLLVFSGFFIWIIRRLWYIQTVSTKRPVAIAAWTMMFVFISASLGMEVMYQRYLWFILGWAISIPSKT